jgi:membrane-associated PAP2 superfamily phosphatase
VARWFGSAAGFAWRDAWWARTVLHDGGRWLGLGVLLLFAVDAACAVTPGPGRRERLFWLALAITAALLVPALKRVSMTSCPWDLLEFGGAATYVSHWQLGVRDGGPGHCFPSGHAVTAFAFFSLYFLWRPYRPVLARMMLGAVVALGLIFGLTQLVRGAHFPSHIFWSAWLCWALCVVASTGRQAVACCWPACAG